MTEGKLSPHGSQDTVGEPQGNRAPHPTVHLEMDLSTVHLMSLGLCDPVISPNPSGTSIVSPWSRGILDPKHNTQGTHGADTPMVLQWVLGDRKHKALRAEARHWPHQQGDHCFFMPGEGGEVLVVGFQLLFCGDKM